MELDPNTLFMTAVATAIYAAVTWARTKKRPALVPLAIFAVSAWIALIVMDAIL